MSYFCLISPSVCSCMLLQIQFSKIAFVAGNVPRHPRIAAIHNRAAIHQWCYAFRNVYTHIVGIIYEWRRD